jgi:ABC-type transport system involved in multi-copper enzyme maturation permease subunit
MSDVLLFLNALRDAVRPRRLLIAALLIALPPLLGIIWSTAAPREDALPSDIYDSVAFGLVFLFTLPILAVVYGTGVVSQEIEGRTILYLLTRPFPWWESTKTSWC